jgi:hypothetical protein
MDKVKSKSAQEGQQTYNFQSIGHENTVESITPFISFTFQKLSDVKRTPCSKLNHISIAILKILSIHSLCSLSYDRSTASSKASSAQSAI